MDQLRAEYVVVVKKNSPFCSSVKTFNHLLSANEDIEIKPSKLRHKDLEVNYEVHKSELPKKDIRLFHLKFICDQENKVDEFDELLKPVRSISYKTEGEVKILWDDISLHYSIKAYPIINEIENLMRRLIVQFMLTTIGVNWDKEALPKDIKDNVKKRKGGDKDVTSLLNETDFKQLADCLFTAYSEKDKRRTF